MTRYQLRILKLYARFQQQPISVLTYLRLNAKSYVVQLIAFVVLTIPVYAWYGMVSIAFMASIFAATVLRDVGHFRRAAMIWPAWQQVIDWDKVNAILAESEARVATKGAR